MLPINRQKNIGPGLPRECPSCTWELTDHVKQNGATVKRWVFCTNCGYMKMEVNEPWRNVREGGKSEC
jgi:C4-type Zn-finger protein